MHAEDPLFPPLLTGHGIRAPERAVPYACHGAANGTLGAGDVVWARNTQVAEFAFVFEPDVVRARAMDMRLVFQTAIADGLGTLMPSQTAIHFGWPDTIIVNGAKLGETLLITSEREDGGVPDWLVAAGRLVLTRDLDGLEPGLVRDESSLAEEDGADLDRSTIIGTISAHVLVSIRDWEEAGTRAFADRWLGRVLGYEQSAIFDRGEGRDAVRGMAVGVSDGACLLVKGESGPVETFPPPDARWPDAPGQSAVIGAPWQ